MHGVHGRGSKKISGLNSDAPMRVELQRRSQHRCDKWQEAWWSFCCPRCNSVDAEDVAQLLVGTTSPSGLLKTSAKCGSAVSGTGRRPALPFKLLSIARLFCESHVEFHPEPD